MGPKRRTPAFVRVALTVLLATAFASSAVAQVALLSSTTFNGGNDDSANAVVTAANGDIYVAGYSSSAASGADQWIGRYSSSLTLISSVTINGSANGPDFIYDLAFGPNGNLYAVGNSSIAGVGNEAWIGQFTTGLTLVSSAAYASSVAYTGHYLHTVAFSNAGLLYAAGNFATSTTTHRMWITKLDPTTLVILSSTTFFNGFDSNDIQKIAIDSSGNIFVAGSVAPLALTSHDIWVGKFNSSLVLQSSATVAGAGGNTDAAFNLALHSNGSVYYSALINNAGATVDAWIGKYSSSLALQSSLSINGSAASDDVAYGMALGNNGNIIVSGYLNETGQGANFWLAEYTAALALVSSRTVNSGGATADKGYALSVDTTAATAVVVGVTGAVPDIWIGKFSITPSSPTAPTGFAGTATSSTSIQWGWTDASVTEAGYRVMSGAVNLSGNLAANTTAWLQTGLTANATSGTLLARAYNVTGTADSGSIQLYTLSDPPNSISATFYGSSCAFTWPTMTNPPSTRWSVERGTNGVSYAALSFSSAAAAYTDNTGMSVGTSYYYRIRSANDDGVYSFHANASAIVFTGGGIPLAPSAFAGVAQSSTSILWSWTDNSTVETGFRIMSGATNVSGNLAVDATTWLQTGLAVNTSSGALFVQAFNSTGTTNSGSVTRYSLANIPTGFGAAGVTASSVTVSWSGSGTVYQLERSTGSGFTVIASSAVVSYGNTGLASASTYYYRVLALNGDSIATAYTSTITVITLPTASGPNAPSAFAGVAQSSTSILWSWTDNASTELGFRVMSGATNVSGNLAVDATTWLQTGLAVNTSSGALFVQAFNSTGTADSGSLTRYSLASIPTGLSSSSVFQTSATLTWTAGNPAGTVFELEVSTGSGFGLKVSSTAVSYLDTTLASASTYYYRVRALNQDSVATGYSSTATVITFPTPGPAAPTGFAGAAQSVASILWSWTDNAVNEAGDRVLSGAVNISSDLAASSTQWLQTALSTNTSYGPFLVQAFNAGGTANSGTGTRWTLAAVPTALAAAGVYQTSVTVSWNANANPAGTTFQLERSTGTGYGLLLSGTATYYFDGYLTPSATHFYRVRAVNGEAVATAYASTITVVALPAPAVPGSAGTPVGAALGTSSATWTWVLAAGATNHFMFRPSDASYIGSSSSGPFVMTALTPNTVYGLRVAGVNVGGTGPLSPSASVYTLAATPSGPAAVSITSTALVASWGLNGNPGSTVAQLLRSTNAVVYSTLTVGAVASYADADLIGCTTYYYRVRNLNGDGLATPYVSFQGVTANTNPSPASGLTAAANAGGTVGLVWGLSPTEGITGYRLFWDAGTGTVSYGAPLAVLTSTQTAYTTGVLTSSAAYIFALRATHRCGVEETAGALALSGAATAPAVVRAAIKEPDSGRRVNGNRVTILGELIAGTPSDVQQVLFQYKLATSTAWLDVDEANVNHPNPDFSFPYFTHADATVMAAGSYDLRAVAYDRNGVPDAAPPAVRVVVDPISPDISEGTTVDGKIKKDQTISNTVASVVDTAGAGASDPAVRVSIPAGVVTSATATVSVTANPTITTAAPAGQSLIGSAIKIDLSNGQSALNGTAEISLTYPDTVLFPSLLHIYYLNEATGQWSRDFNSVVNTTSRTVTGLTPHFSTFAIMLGTAFSTSLDTVQVYPVPYKPNGSNADEGVPFSNTNANSGIIFASLTSGSTIKIYTLTGRLVSSLDAPSIAGTVRWDARNQDGRDVASGAYFAVISAAGQKNVIRKLVIIR